MRRKRILSLLSLLLALSFCLPASGLAQAARSSQPADNLTEDQQIDFLLHAKVVASKGTAKGITHPSRMTMTDGLVTHDTGFQTVDEHNPVMKFDDGHTEFNFVDSYHYDIAAYQLARLLGMDNMVPVYVERSLNDEKGALSWWITAKFDEQTRLQQKVEPPDQDAWNKQMYKIRVFDQLVFDTDPNLTNVLITPDWKIWRIDFTRAFRLSHDLGDPKELVMCDRQLFDKLQALDGDELLAKTKLHLTPREVQAVMARRDKIVAYFKQQIAEKGESAVLY